MAVANDRQHARLTPSQKFFLCLGSFALATICFYICMYFNPTVIHATCTVIDSTTTPSLCRHEDEFVNCQITKVKYELAVNEKTYVHTNTIKLASDKIEAKSIPCYYYESNIDTSLCLNVWDLPTHVFETFVFGLIGIISGAIFIVAGVESVIRPTSD